MRTAGAEEGTIGKQDKIQMVDTFKLMGIILLSIKTVKGEPLKCRPSQITQELQNCPSRAKKRLIDWLVLVWLVTVHLPLLTQPQEL